MAEIKIERKQGTNWVWWLLALAVIAALGWWLLAQNDDPAYTAVDGGEAVPVATTGPVTQLGVLTAAGAANLVGRPVAISGVPVQEVVSDRGFWVGNATERAFVVRANQASANTPPDGAVNAGQNVTVWGTVQQMPTDLTQQATEWNLRSTDATTLSGQPVYVQADSVRIL